MKEIDTQNNIPFSIYPTVSVCIYSDGMKETPQHVIFPKQTHGSRVVEILDGTENRVDCDGLLTRNKNVILGIQTRDCVPVCFADRFAVGIAHIGWRGLCKGLPAEMLKNFDIGSLVVYVGPFLREFEIKKDFCYDEIMKTFGETYILEKDEKIFFEFQKALASVLPDATLWDSRNTYDDHSLPSNRRGGTYNFVTTISYEH